MLEKPQAFLNGIDKIYVATGCSGARTVELAGFRLEDVAQEKHVSLHKGRPVGAALLTWDVSTGFLNQFLPLSIRHVRAREFELLV